MVKNCRCSFMYLHPGPVNSHKICTSCKKSETGQFWIIMKSCFNWTNLPMHFLGKRSFSIVFSPILVINKFCAELGDFFVRKGQKNTLF